MSTLQVNVAVSINGALVETGGLGVADHSINFSPSNLFTNGVGANQANQVFSSSRNLAASATENLDLSGAMANALGVVVVLIKVKALLIRARATNTNDVVVGAAATNGFWAGMFGTATDSIRIHPGGMFLITAPDVNGIPVTASTADLLKVTNGSAGTAIDYDIVVIGVA